MIKKTERSEAAQHGSAVTNGGEARSMDELKYIYYLLSINNDNTAPFHRRQYKVVAEQYCKISLLICMVCLFLAATAAQ